jgi:hypothetical protein
MFLGTKSIGEQIVNIKIMINKNIGKNVLGIF